MSSPSFHPPAAAPSGLTPKGRRTRRAILDAALTLFADTGTNAVSLRAIASQVGISLAGLLRYFPGRDELVIAALDLRDTETIHETLGQPRADPEDPSAPEEMLTAFVRALALNESLPGTVAVFSKAAAEATSPSHVAHEHFQRRYEQIRTALETAFTAHFAANGSSADPSIAAVSLIALADGAQVQWLLDPQPGGLVVPVIEFLALHGIQIDIDVADATSARSSTC